MSIELRNILADLPKIDLHRHLEGSIRPATLADVCRINSAQLPTYDPDELSSMLRIKDPAENLSGFLLPFKLMKFCFVNREAIARITYEAIEDAWLDNVAYVELRFSPEFMAFYYRLSLIDVMDGIVDGLELAKRAFPVTAKLIVSISRNLSPETMMMPWPAPVELVRLALDYADRGVAGLDLAGIESGYPPEIFTDAFDLARSEGLGITVHAGEDAGPESIRGAIEHLGATRIGHGVRIVNDPKVLTLALERGVTLELCPTSNVLTHAVESLDSHPVRVLYDAGVKVTVNTDDPTVCGVTLTDEYELIMREFGFELPEIERMIKTAQEAAFAL